jgi:hypothetical protein
MRLALTRPTETATTPSLAERRAQRSERLPSCRDQQVLAPLPPSRGYLRVVGGGCPGSRTVLADGRTAVCVSTRTIPPPASAPPLDSPCGSPSAETRDASDRLSAISIASYEHPRLAGSRKGARFWRMPNRGAAWFTPERLASVGPHVSPYWDIGRAGRFLPSRGPWGAAPLTLLSPPPNAEGCSRTLEHVRNRRDRSCCARVKTYIAQPITTRSVFRRARTLAPQRPFERSAPDFPGGAVWPPHHRFSTPFHPPAILVDVRTGQAPVHAHRCQRLARFSWALDAACRLLQPVTTRGHTLRAIDPRARVELAPHYTPAPTDAGCVGRTVRRRTENQRATVRARRLVDRRAPLAWTGRTAGRGAGAKAGRAFFERFARALLVDTSGIRCRQLDSPRKSGTPSRFLVPAETHRRSRLAKGDAFGRVRMPSLATEPLRDRSRCRLRARQNRCTFTPPRKEALLGSAVAFVTASALPHPDGESSRRGSTYDSEKRSFLAEW